MTETLVAVLAILPVVAAFLFVVFVVVCGIRLLRHRTGGMVLASLWNGICSFDAKRFSPADRALWLRFTTGFALVFLAIPLGAAIALVAV
jgi:ABC-type phosphate transport system permease subunit